jgi:uncharacterized membrane protein YjdF
VARSPRKPAQSDPAAKVYRWITIFIVTVMTIDFVFVVVKGQWFSAALILIIASVLLAPAILGDRLPVRVPYEFQLVILVFVFAALFLGEIRSYYERFWWWDIVLHTASGFLLGIFGFLLVYVLNENRRINLSMRPRFVALFAFLFAVAMGAVWEIFEFSMDQLFGTTMQKPMLGDPSGLTDTMWDLIVDTLGAAAIALLGWSAMRKQARSFIDDWIAKFIERNPAMFR